MSQVAWEARESTHLESDLAEVPQCPHKRRHGGGVVERMFPAAALSNTDDVVAWRRKQLSLGMRNIKTSRRNNNHRDLQLQNDNTKLFESPRVSDRVTTQYTSPERTSPRRAEVFNSKCPINDLRPPIPGIDACDYNDRPG